MEINIKKIGKLAGTPVYRLSFCTQVSMEA